MTPPTQDASRPYAASAICSCPAAATMKNPFNTLFGQLALMTVGLIVIIHLTSLVLVDRDRGQIDTGYARRALLLAVQAQRDGPVTASQVSATLGVSAVDASDAIPYGCPAPCR